MHGTVENIAKVDRLQKDQIVIVWLCRWRPGRSVKCFVLYIFRRATVECVGHSFAYVAYFVILRDVWIRTQRPAVASMRATNLATHLPVKSVRVWCRAGMKQMSHTVKNVYGILAGFLTQT
jgi:hypothetical protein